MNTGTLNSYPLNTIPQPLAAASIREDIQIDDLGLQNPDVLSLIDDDDFPTREIKTQSNATQHGSHLLSARWRAKRITVKGLIKKNSKDELTDYLTTFKRALRKEAMNLYVRKKSNSVISYPVILEKDGVTIERDKHYQINHANFELRLLCVTAFGEDETYNSISNTGITSLSFPFEIETVSTEITAPVFILSFTAAVAVTKVKITNSANDQYIEITNSFTASDILEIDGDAISDIVQKNSTTIPSDGEIPDLEVGKNTITIEITGTSATYDLTAKFKNKFL